MGRVKRSNALSWIFMRYVLVMGLFFAKTVAEKYGGGIKLSSSENTGGARVEIFFLSSQETS